MSNLNIIYGANLSGKTRYLSEMYTNSHRDDFNKKAIYIPVQRINIEFKSSTSYGELDNIEDYILERRNQYKQGKLIEFLSNVLDTQNEKINKILEELFEIKLVENPNCYSDGIRAILAILLELELISNFNEAEVYVLIDEVDGFLYPHQQSIIIDKIIEIYPQFNYIVTSHSGLVTLNLSLKPKEFMMENGVMTQIYREKTTNIASVYNEIFDLEPRNKEIIELSDLLSKIIYDEKFISRIMMEGNISELKNQVEFGMQKIRYLSEADYSELSYLYEIATRIIDDNNL